MIIQKILPLSYTCGETRGIKLFSTIIILCQHDDACELRGTQVNKGGSMQSLSHQHLNTSADQK